MDDKVTCSNCHWIKDQSGSAHKICPKMPDFSLGWHDNEYWKKLAEECGLFIPKQEDYDSYINAFMAWMAHSTVWPEEHEMIAKHDEWKESIGGEHVSEVES